MADILKGAGGTAVSNDTSEKLSKMRESGAAMAAMEQYMSGNNENTPVLSYTYKPYVPGPLEPSTDTTTTNPVAPDQPAVILKDSGDAAYNEKGEWIGSGSGMGGPGYTGITDMIDGGGPGKIGNTFKGGLYSGALNVLGVTPYGFNQPMYDSGPSFSDYEKSGALDVFKDKDGSISIPNVAPVGGASIGVGGTGGASTNSNGVDFGGQPSADNAADAASGNYADNPDFMNYGGEVKGYNHGGLPQDPYAIYRTIPVAKTVVVEAPLTQPLREGYAQDQSETPWYSQMGKDVGTDIFSKVLMSLVSGPLGLNKGGKVCPCGTPGCPGCGKGYNHGGPIKNQNMPALYDDYFQGVHRPGRDARFMNDRLPDGSYIPEVYNRGLQYNQDRDDITMKYHGGTHMFKDDTYAGGASGPLAMAERNAQYAKYVDDIKALREQGIDAQNNKTFGQTYRADSSFAKGPSVDSTYGQMVTGYKEQVPKKGFFQSAKSYKEEIARNESDAKIRREDFKALADIKKKLKGPLQ